MRNDNDNDNNKYLNRVTPSVTGLVSTGALYNIKNNIYKLYINVEAESTLAQSAQCCGSRAKYIVYIDRKFCPDERLGAKLGVTENRCVLFNLSTYVNYIYL